MTEPVSLLLIEFLRWVASHPRTYTETMEAWRSTCPRQTVWEDALVEGLIQIETADGRSEVTLTSHGSTLLDAKLAAQSSQNVTKQATP